MVASLRRPSARTKGAVGADAGLSMGNSAWLFTGTTAPVNGVAGTGAGFAGPGSMYVRADGVNSKVFINTNTKASPTWTVIGTQT